MASEIEGTEKVYSFVPVRFSFVLCLTHRSLLNAACVTWKTLLDLLHVPVLWYVLPTS